MATLPRDEVLWRRVALIHVQSDGTPESAAFKTQQLCVHRAHLTSIAAVLTEDPTAHVYAFTVSDAFDAGASDVTDDRLPTEPPSHAMVLGTHRGNVGRRLRSKATKVHP